MLTLQKSMQDSSNIFAYCNNNPITNLDADGHLAQAVIGAIMNGLIAWGLYCLEYYLGMRKWNYGVLIGQIIYNAAAGAFLFYLGLGGKLQKIKRLFGIAQKFKIRNTVVKAIGYLAKGLKFIGNMIIKGFSRKPGESWISGIRRFAKQKLGVKI